MKYILLRKVSFSGHDTTEFIKVFASFKEAKNYINKYPGKGYLLITTDGEVLFEDSDVAVFWG